MRIEQLSKKTLKQTNSLLIKIFENSPKDYDYPPKWLKASINKKSSKELFSKFDVTYFKYWVAIDKSKVVGVIGLYSLAVDKHNTLWTGWFGVSPKSRGKGIGTKLLDFIIQKSRRANKKFLRLYTSDSLIESDAQKLYDKVGFKRISKDKLKKLGFASIYDKSLGHEGETKIYKELKL